MRLKGNQSTMVYNPENIWREMNSRAPESKEGCQLSDEPDRNIFVPLFKFERGNAVIWKPFLTVFSVDSQNGSRDFEFPNGMLHEPSMENNKSPSFSVSTEEHKVQHCPESEFASCPVNESKEGHGSSEGGSDFEPMTPCECADADDSGNNRAIYGQVHAQRSSDSHLGNQDPPEIHTSGSTCRSNFETATSLGAKLLNQKNGTGSSLRLVIGELNNERTEGMQLPSQIPSVLLSSEQEDSTPDPSKQSDKVPLASNKCYDDTDSALDQEKLQMGERSFSTASFISYSGPVTNFGDLSMRSDGSISGRSFAFPVLQPEWDSSPVRMAKAEGRRHFRTQRGWRSGILCCRF